MSSLDTFVRVLRIGSEPALSSRPPGGFEIFVDRGLGRRVEIARASFAACFSQSGLQRVEAGRVDALGLEPRPNPSAGPTLATAALDLLLGEALVVDIAATDQPIDHLRDPVEDRARVFVRSFTAGSQTPLEDATQPMPSGLPLGHVADRFSFEPRGIEGQGVASRARPAQALGIAFRVSRLVRFHGSHATKSNAVAEAGAQGSSPEGPRARQEGRKSMPELPEVETTRRMIAPLMVGKRIERVVTTAPSYFFLTPPAQLRELLEGRRIESLDRAGKYLVAGLGRGDRLLLHLGMTGQLFSSEATSVRLLSATVRAALPPDAQLRFEPDEHTHLQLVMEGASPRIFFRDVRKFGKVQWLAAGEANARLDRLGTDALVLEGEELFRANRGRRVAIKTMLLDQSVAAGVGNIYADEALFLAGVRPGRAAGRVTRRECQAITDALHRVLERSIETGGSSISDYVAPDGSDGGYQDERKVYAREGEACPTCGDSIKRRIIAQRSSHYCSRCQS